MARRSLGAAQWRTTGSAENGTPAQSQMGRRSLAGGNRRATGLDSAENGTPAQLKWVGGVGKQQSGERQDSTPRKTGHQRKAKWVGGVWEQGNGQRQGPTENGTPAQSGERIATVTH